MMRRCPWWLAFVLGACGPQVATSGGGSGDSSDTTSADTTGPGGGEGEGEGEGGGDIYVAVDKDVDILFVIDNSGSMGPAQGTLAASFPAFINVLDAADVRADYRIGVTTTDNGNPWCGPTTPEAGKLQLSSCRGRTGEFVFAGNPPADATAVACLDHCQFEEISTRPTATELDAEPLARPWLEGSQGVTNIAETGGVTPTAAEALQCIGPQGIAGCGFEQPLESMYKALVRAQTAGEEQFDFVRPNAILAVVIVTDEVDCSHSGEHESIFYSEEMGGNRVFWSDPNATAPSSALCWNAGVVCEGGPGVYDVCTAANKDENGNVDVGDSDAVLHPVSRYIELLQELEDLKRAITPDREVLVSLITGVPNGYDSGEADIVYVDASNPTEQLDFGIGAGCINNAVEPPLTARPPVRERELAEAFAIGEQRNLYSICDNDYSPALDAIANAIRDQIRPACMPSCVADTDPISAGLDPACVLVQSSPSPTGYDEWNVPTCHADGSVPDNSDVCYVPLVDLAGQNSTPSPDDDMSPECTEQGWNLEFRIVRRPGVPVPGGTTMSAVCELSENKSIDCPLLP